VGVLSAFETVLLRAPIHRTRLSASLLWLSCWLQTQLCFVGVKLLGPVYPCTFLSLRCRPKRRLNSQHEGSATHRHESEELVLFQSEMKDCPTFLWTCGYKRNSGTLHCLAKCMQLLHCLRFLNVSVQCLVRCCPRWSLKASFRSLCRVPQLLLELRSWFWLGLVAMIVLNGVFLVLGNHIGNESATGWTRHKSALGLLLTTVSRFSIYSKGH